MYLKSLFRLLVYEQSGADMIEYALVMALIGLASVAGLKQLGSAIGTALNNAASTVTSTL
jgi:Flp pilus assembly pilin Flp